jgi:hypothetical protein
MQTRVSLGGSRAFCRRRHPFATWFVKLRCRPPHHPPFPLLALSPFYICSLCSPSAAIFTFGYCRFPRPPLIPHLCTRQPAASPHSLSPLRPTRFGGREHTEEVAAALILHCGGIPHRFAASVIPGCTWRRRSPPHPVYSPTMKGISNPFGARTSCNERARERITGMTTKGITWLSGAVPWSSKNKLTRGMNLTLGIYIGKSHILSPPFVGCTPVCLAINLVQLWVFGFILPSLACSINTAEKQIQEYQTKTRCIGATAI